MKLKEKKESARGGDENDEKNKKKERGRRRKIPEKGRYLVGLTTRSTFLELVLFRIEYRDLPPSPFYDVPINFLLSISWSEKKEMILKGVEGCCKGV